MKHSWTGCRKGESSLDLMPERGGAFQRGPDALLCQPQRQEPRRAAGAEQVSLLGCSGLWKGNRHAQIQLSYSHLWTGVLLQFASQKEAGGAEELQARDPDPACSHVAVHEMDGQVEGLISQIQILLGGKKQR